jgi:CrcB protein
MRKVILVLAGGFCGTLTRYLLAAPLLSLARVGLPGADGFPYEILIVNLAGAFAIGLLYGLSDRGAIVSPNVRLALGTGFLGAFTTFSTLAYGGEQLLQTGTWTAGALYLGGSLMFGVVFVRMGYRCAGFFARPISSTTELGEQGERAKQPASLATVWREQELSLSDQDDFFLADGIDVHTARIRIPDEVR